MKAVIFAGSKGRYMFPLTDSRPKAMLSVSNKPIMEYVLMSAKDAGINDFVVIVSYKSEMIRSYFKDGAKWGINIKYRTQEETIGTADALLHAKDTVKDEPFLVIHGDVIVNAKDIKKIANSDGYAIGIKKTEHNTVLGSVITENGYVKSIIEKSEDVFSEYVNTGIYKLDKAIFDVIKKTPLSPRGELELPEALSLYANQFNGKIQCIECDTWLNITRPWDLLTMNELFIPKKANVSNEAIIEENVHLKGNISIGKGTIIRAGSYLEGDILIGENCDIGPSCRIRGTTSIGNNCHIGSFVELKNSIVMDGSKLPHFNYVGDSVIGENCNFGAGSKVANLRFDHKDINNSGRHKLGALVGDNVNIGINACINPGTYIGNNAMIGPGTLAHGTIMPESKVF